MQQPTGRRGNVAVRTYVDPARPWNEWGPAAPGRCWRCRHELPRGAGRCPRLECEARQADYDESAHEREYRETVERELRDLQRASRTRHIDSIRMTLSRRGVALATVRKRAEQRRAQDPADVEVITDLMLSGVATQAAVSEATGLHRRTLARWLSHTRP